MRIFISADIEGVTGCTVWDETEKGKLGYDIFAEQMTREVNAACEGANMVGVKEIIIKDAHDSGRNIDHSKLPRNTKLVRGWSGGLFSMIQEFDETFDALIFIGYHSAASTDTNPLSHTMTLSLDYIKINGVVASEFLIHSYIAAYLGVPVVFLSGDKGLCSEAKTLNNNIETVAVKEGRGNSTINIHPQLALDLIKEGVKNALKVDRSNCIIELPKEFDIEMRYKEHKDAYRASFYPGIKRIDENTIKFKSEDYMEVLQMMNYLI
ncbi:M55 family metallopeptidase [Tissierella sp. Yu-01]|uniref:M55 family metallopeptidase n=1 Tax=Tissierella sp. Yu-01 TaxID=3035694 RepID=UPI00240CFD97|nr:M55 family metallopeptidase [Tissierella sp. Yu-01]WFA09934.1 M55 family metallopeptidase [Tissierella sp. Yu-01]